MVICVQDAELTEESLNRIGNKCLGIWRKNRQLVMTIASVWWLTGCYLAKQALYQNDLFNSRRRTDDVIDDAITPDETKKQLQLVSKILNFAEINGLNATGAYRFFVDNKSRSVSFIVQAAYPDRFESITWWFPFVGRVPYLGFFLEEERDSFADELLKMGFDIDKGEASAFSSLGWFEDPVFSSMLNRRPGDLVHLILHELVHRTVWLVGSTQFNEQLAEYVAEVLTTQFIKKNFDPAELARYQAKRKDRLVFQRWLRDLKESLSELYSARGKLNLDDLMGQKRRLISSFERAPLRPEFKQVDYIRAGKPWNNAAILASALYASEATYFEALRQCLDPKGSIASFLMILDDQSRGLEEGIDINVALDGRCS